MLLLYSICYMVVCISTANGFILCTFGILINTTIQTTCLMTPINSMYVYIYNMNNPYLQLYVSITPKGIYYITNTNIVHCEAHIIGAYKYVIINYTYQYNRRCMLRLHKLYLNWISAYTSTYTLLQQFKFNTKLSVMYRPTIYDIQITVNSDNIEYGAILYYTYHMYICINKPIQCYKCLYNIANKHIQ